MEKERIERYKEKIELAHKRLENIEENFENFDNEIIKLGVYKAFQEVVEAITDLISMILIDRGNSVGDDYVNIDKIRKIINLSDKEVELLEEANGLRNRIIHKYNKTDDKKAKNSIERIVSEIQEILNKLSKFIERVKDGKARN